MGNLNKQQLEASMPDSGISLVIAGAGTGKTTTMIQKISNVLSCSGLTPDNLLILTFSRKAAEEIKKRLKSRSDGDIAPLFSGTFHSFALYILRQYRSEYMNHFKLSSFPEIITEEKKNEIIREIILKRKELFLGIPCDTVFNLAEKIERLNPHTIEKLKTAGIYSLIKDIPQEYRRYKGSRSVIDFDDMIVHASLLLRNIPEIRNALL